MKDERIESASLEDQITLLRCMYVLLRKRCYTNRFRMLLTVLLMKNQAHYETQITCLSHLMNIVENNLNRMEADRAFRYLLCLQNKIISLEKHMVSDCKKYWPNLSVPKLSE